MSAQTNETFLHLSIPVDADTHRRLMDLANMCHADPKSVAASLLHDILKEDEDAHMLELLPSAGRA